MEGTCSRCNKRVGKNELIKGLCNRCQDVLEFGYPSFPSYPLEVSQEVIVKKQDKELVLI